MNSIIERLAASGSLDVVFILFLLIVGALSAVIVLLQRSLFKSRNMRSELEDRVEILQDKESELHHILLKQQSAQDELWARQDLTDRLLRMVRSTLLTTSLDIAFEKILDAACAATRAELGSLFLLDASGRVTDSFLSRRSGGIAESKKLTGQVMREGLAGWLVKTGQAIILDDAQADSRWITLPDEPYVAGSVLGVPINNGVTVTGIMTLIHSDKGHFRIEDLGLMQDAASQIALAIRNAQIFEEQRRMVERQTSLYDVLRLISQNLRSDLVAENTVSKVAEITEWSMVTLLQPDMSGEYLVSVSSAGEYQVPTDFQVKLDQNSAAGRAFMLGKTELVHNIKMHPSHIPFNADLESELFVPIKFNGDIQSLLCFGDKTPYLFSDEDVTLAESITEAVSLAIANAQLFEKTANQSSRLQALIAASHDGIILIGIDHSILVINQPAIDGLCVNGTPREWIGKPMPELVSRVKQINAPFAEQFEQVMSSENILLMPDLDGEHDIGANVYRVSYTPVMGDSESIGTLCVLRDMTEERLLNRMREDLTRSIVHDLKNPLWMLNTGLSMLEDTLEEKGNLGQQEEDYFTISSAQVERMLGLVNAILDISRLENRKIPLNKEVQDIRKPIEEMLRFLEPQSFEKSIDLRFLKSDGPIMLSFDEVLISRVLQNLVGNALKFTPQNGKIEVDAEITEEKMLKVSVSDTGPGVPPHVRSRIFEKFTTGDQEESGTGLGLAFCKMAIEAHDGEIYLEDAPGGGARFVFQIPFLADTDSPSYRNGYSMTPVDELAAERSFQFSVRNAPSAD